MNAKLTAGVLGAAFVSMAPAIAVAQQNPNKPGAPGATTTIDGRYLPAPPQRFRGEVLPNAAGSMQYWPSLVAPPEGAPNILLIMTDDVGFGAPSTFGGVIPTPALDRVAQMGLRYTRFHTTALCSPTRAALLTGRNHHSVATGVVVDQATGFPGYDSVIPRDAVAIGETLRLNGYDTSWYGKDHNVPQWVASQAGPFTDWPTGPVKGFDYYYGFIGDDTSQWQPGNLFQNTTPIEPYLDNPEWNLITAMADEAIARINMLNEVQPDRPFLIYYAPGGTHAPHHPTPEWIERITEMRLFDDGWNKLRETIFANQKMLGVIPQDAKLTAWPKDLPTWDKLPEEAKRLYVRQANVYGAYLAYTDHEIGRVIQAVEDVGKLDNTLIIYISGDNGASPEGTLHGLYSEFSVLNGLSPTVEQNTMFYDVWGTDQTYPHFAVPWAWALGTPYQWTKEVASHFGGTRNGMAIAWPARIRDGGGIRHQFHHVIDIVPTLLEAAGLPEPISVNGITQKPIEGVSMMYTFGTDGADAPGRRITQYFEMFGSRAIYHDEWIASAPPPTPPWQALSLGSQSTDVMNGFTWELYDLNTDWTQATNLGPRLPDRMRDMQQLFTLQAEKYQVFPLNDLTLPRFIGVKPSYTYGRTEFNYSGSTLTYVPFPGVGGAPNVLNKSYLMTAEIEVPEGGAEGMIVTDGGRFSGYAFYLLNGVPVFTWNLLQLEHFRWQGTEALAPGRHTLEFEFSYDGPGMGKGGTGTLKVDGRVVDTKSMPKTLPVAIGWVEVFNVGIDRATPINNDYQVPFRFTGKLHNLRISLGPEQLTQEERGMIHGVFRSRQ